MIPAGQREAAMDWKEAMEEERAALMRTVALLFALAGLAELAASRSPAMRGFVLWILRRAEAAAREFVAGDPDTRLAPMPVGPAGTRPADAMRLAASLRALARLLEHQARLMLAARSGSGAQPEPPPLRRFTAMRGVARTLSVLTVFALPVPCPVPDTS